MSAASGVSAPPLRAVLWDFDGTLVDSHDCWTETWAAMARRRGGTWTNENTLALVGLDLLDAAKLIAEHLSVDDEPAALVEEMVGGVAEQLRAHVPWRAGARELLESIREQDIPCALVTMSYRSLVDPVLERLAPDTFAAVVTGDEVSLGKPHPMAYLTAADRLDVDPGDCLAIEDSPTGIASAVSAGCRVLVAPNHGFVDAGPAGHPVETLVGLTAADLLALMTGD